GDALDGADVVVRRRVALGAQVVPGRIDGTRRSRELRAVHALTDVRRAQVEAVARRVDANGIKISTVQHLDADDASRVRRYIFLNERRAVEPELHRPLSRPPRGRIARSEREDPGPPAPKVRLDEDGKTHPAGPPARRGGR